MFRLSVHHASGCVVVGGELDHRHRHLLLDGLRTLVPTPHPSWTVDLAEVTFCDTSGLGALVEGHGLAREHHRGLAVVRPSDCVHRQLVLGGLEPLLCPSPDRSGATDTGPSWPRPRSADLAGIRRPLPHRARATALPVRPGATHPTGVAGTGSPPAPAPRPGPGAAAENLPGVPAPVREHPGGR
ncbi:STAS domain-containing protein [Blastococcus deserti]|uniref:STAS domain-containing protein n=1 Tax=Blastococcus deserti TaxID=2259033 RepID=A0ABW4X6Z6_9ACTN